jgi:hypothetical protein
MTKKLVRAALVAGLALFVATTAYGADSKPKLSRSVNTILVEVSKSTTAKDWPTAIAKLKEAQAITDSTDYDKYIIETYLGVAYFNTGDMPATTAAFDAAASSPAIPADELEESVHKAMVMEYNASNYGKVIELSKLVLKPGQPFAERIATLAASAYYLTNDYADAMTLAQKIIDTATAAGHLPDRGAYQIVFSSQNRQKNVPGETKTLEIMSNYYGESDDWSRLDDVALGTLSSPNKANRELAALYIYRLRLITGTETTGDDYLLMAELSLGLNSPGDAERALREGSAKGLTNPGKAAPLKAKADARSKGDEAALPAAEAAAAKSASGNEDVSVAEGYFGYGHYADAERVARNATGKGGAKLLEAKLLLGAAQAMQNKPEAVQSLADVKGDSSLERAAQLWTIYATRKYGKAAAAPAAPAAQ